MGLLVTATFEFLQLRSIRLVLLDDRGHRVAKMNPISNGQPPSVRYMTSLGDWLWPHFATSWIQAKQDFMQTLYSGHYFSVLVRLVEGPIVYGKVNNS